MKVLIIEDEVLAQERLSNLLLDYDSSIEIVACLESIEESVEWLRTKAHPDLLLMDIHLSDGHSFEILKKVTVTKPIIFTTAYDQYALDAFQHFSIDYILKPITKEALANAINKYKTVSGTMPQKEYGNFIDAVNDNIGNTYKNRFLAKVGQRLFFIPTADIAYFSVDNKIVYLFDLNNNRFIINHTMEKLETLLSPVDFFRINRKIIINIEAIEQVKPYYNNRMLVQLKKIPTAEDFVISRDRVTDFKNWAEG